MLLYVTEAVEGGFCSPEVLRVLEAMCSVLLCMLEAVDDSLNFEVSKLSLVRDYSLQMTVLELHPTETLWCFATRYGGARKSHVPRQVLIIRHHFLGTLFGQRALRLASPYADLRHTTLILAYHPSFQWEATIVSVPPAILRVTHLNNSVLCRRQ